MDPELYAILNIYKSKNRSLSVQDVTMLLDISDFDAWKPIKHLLDDGYLGYSSGYRTEDGSVAVDTKLCLTYAGELAMRDDKRSKKAHFWIEFRAWGTLAIALIALVVSIISLWLQWR